MANKKVEEKPVEEQKTRSLLCAFNFHNWVNNKCTRCGARK